MPSALRRAAIALLPLAISAPLSAAPPQAVSPPVITGTALPGHLLSGTRGTWAEMPASFSYQWQKDGIAIAGAISPDYTVPYTAAPGSGFQFQVTALSSDGSGTATSAETTVAAYDEDAAGWFTRVEDAGSSFDLSTSNAAYDDVYTKAVWNEFILDLKTAGIWTAIGDLSAFCGVRDLAGTSIKIKGTGTNLIQNLTSANYAAAGATAGIKGNGTTGYIDPQRTLSSLGITATNAHAFVYLSTDDYSSIGAAISDNPASGKPRFAMVNAGAGFVHVAGTSNKPSPSGRGFFGITLNANGYQNHSHGTYRSLPTAGVSLVTSNAFNFLRTRSNGVHQYANNRIGLASLGTALGESASWEFHQAVEKLMKNLGVIPDLPKVVFFGDSGAEGIGSSAPENRYTRIVAQGMGMREINLGISSSRLTRNYGTVPAGYYRVAEVLKHAPDLVFIPYGANDASDWLSTGTPNLEQFGVAFTKLIDDLIAGGIPPAKIVATGMSWNQIVANNPTAESMLLAWNANLASIAAAKGVLYIDLYPSSKQGGATEMADSVHANDAGMARRASTILKALETSLVELQLSDGALSPVFSGTVTSYTASVPRATDSITLVPVAADAHSTVSINGTQLSSRSPGLTVDLQTGENVITTMVTSPDGSTNRIYTVTVTRSAMIAQLAWRQAYFGTTEDAETAADLNDPDRDGISNLMEYACGLNPTSQETLPLSAAPAATGNHLEFHYLRSLDAVSDGLFFIVEWCDSFPATWSSAGVTEGVISDDGEIQRVRALVPLNGAHKFARLRVRKP